MVQALNALLECLVTGLFTAVFVVVAARIGMLPITLMVEMDDLEEVDEDEGVAVDALIAICWTAYRT